MSSRTAGFALVLVISLVAVAPVLPDVPAEVRISASAAGRGFVGASWLDPMGSSLTNPAFVGWRPTSFLAVQHARWFGLPELTFQSVAFQKQLLSQPFAVRACRFGGKLYRESSLVLATAWSSGPLRAGVAVRFGETGISRYGARHGSSLDFGILYVFGRSLAVAFSSGNVVARGDHAWVDALDRTFRASLLAAVPGHASVEAEILKDPLYPAEARVGLEFQVVPALALRAGVTAAPARLTLGSRLGVRRLQFDYAFVHHSVLGGTHLFGLVYLFSR